jgi:heme-degrading monooxygenase HmoA
MFVGMNRFQVVTDRGDDFERIWRERDTYSDGVRGFVRFALLRGANGEYLSHSTWASREAFEAWTNSESFRKGHAQGALVGVLVSPPVIGIYDAVLEHDAEA